MIKLVPFKKEHYLRIIENSDQKHLTKYVTESDLESVEDSELSVSCFLGEELLGVGGIVLSHQERGEAWGIVAPDVKKHFYSLHSAVKQFLGRAKLRRIEAVVHNDYPAGHRWVRSLGFKLESTCMKSYSLDGKDASLYAMVKGGADGR